MSLHEQLNAGDWVRAFSAGGSVIEAQAAHDMDTVGSPELELAIGDSAGKLQSIKINVNYWDVTVLRRNLL